MGTKVTGSALTLGLCRHIFLFRGLGVPLSVCLLSFDPGP